MILDEVNEICIVGNSGNLLGSGLGEVIDKQQNVVRFGHGVPSLHSYLRKDIGTKMDIYEVAHINKNYEIAFKEAMKTAKYLFGSVPPQYKQYVAGKEVCNLYPEIQALVQGINYPQGKVISSGLAVMLLCLKHGIKNIKVCGFTFNDNFDIKERYNFYNYKPWCEPLRKNAKHDVLWERDFKTRLLEEGKIERLDL